MSVTLDGNILFDEQQLELELGSFTRDSVERVMPGLDGVLSVDLGRQEDKTKRHTAGKKPNANERQNQGDISAHGWKCSHAGYLQRRGI